MLEDPDEEPNQGPVYKLLQLGMAMLYSHVNLYNEALKFVIKSLLQQVFSLNRCIYWCIPTIWTRRQPSMSILAALYMPGHPCVQVRESVIREEQLPADSPNTRAKPIVMRITRAGKLQRG